MIDKPYNCYVNDHTKINDCANMKQPVSNALITSDNTIISQVIET